MFDVTTELALWEEELSTCGLKNPELRKELCDHLMADYEKLLTDADSPRQAFNQATRNIGPVRTLVREYRKTYGRSISKDKDISLFRESIGTMRFYFVFNGLAATYVSVMVVIWLDDLVMRFFSVLALGFTVPQLYVGAKLEFFLSQHDKLVTGLLIYALCLHVLRFPFYYDIQDFHPVYVWKFLFPVCFIPYLIMNVRRLAKESDIPTHN